VLSSAEVADTIAAGRDYTFQTAENREWYAERKTEALLAGLTSWSPAVRLRSSLALGRREGNFLPQILELLNSKDRYSRYGACEALGRLGPKADPAAPQVRALLNDKDPWLRMLAAKTLAYMGPEVRAAAVPECSARR
jgi:HEAT repeat protein